MNVKAVKIFHRIIFVSLIFILCLGVVQEPSAFKTRKIEPWDNAVFEAISKDYGEAAGNRMRKVHHLIIENQDRPVNEKLELVNDFMNALPWIADPDIWKREDYWATGLETLTTFGGDCEDIAIAKFMTLLLMGIPEDKMGFAYVQTSNGERHMVMVYKDSPEVDSLILDNQHPDVLPSRQRRDLLAIYAFQNNGRLYVIEDDGKNDRKVQGIISDRKLAKWTSLKDRSRKNRKKYEKYNGGRPLFPNEITDEFFKDMK